MKFLKILILVLLILGSYQIYAQSQELTVLPPDKSALTESKILFVYQAGEELSPANIALELNKESIKEGVKYVGNLLYAPLTLKPGENSLALSQNGQVKLKIAYLFQSKDQAVPAEYKAFQFHEAFLGGSCEDCHDLKTLPLSFKNINPPKKEALSICIECHDDKLKAKFIHGPVGSGDCNPCHDPHGSQQVHILRKATTELCYVCHEQEQTQSHLAKLQKTEKDASVCLTCHEPHGTEKKFHLK